MAVSVFLVVHTEDGYPSEGAGVIGVYQVTAEDDIDASTIAREYHEQVEDGDPWRGEFHTLLQEEVVPIDRAVPFAEQAKRRQEAKAKAQGRRYTVTLNLAGQVVATQTSVRGDEQPDIGTWRENDEDGALVFIGMSDCGTQRALEAASRARLEMVCP